ncbi:hypothetical protein F2Q70_00009264 [Brassica cretica]|uniref:Uncharacterized protein n=1 Tax=Brassica cretica TaxID=69181 RepID=A0A8S9M0D6_BRACR|nr:hypothetical protein F2Q68_00002356 [Brassica cretica]KAF2611501.1 hypothetical protein F2Q70_00009264 [Brassica cretica]
MSLESFVSTMAPLIDMEKEAELSMSLTSGMSRNIETAQKKGTTILNLKCVDVQTGLKGRYFSSSNPKKETSSNL